MAKSEIREKNKLLGRTCGNCAFAEPCCEDKKVICGFLAQKMPNQNEMLWYRKNKGGCGHWKGKENEENQ